MRFMERKLVERSENGQPKLPPSRERIDFLGEKAPQERGSVFGSGEGSFFGSGFAVTRFTASLAASRTAT